MINAKKTFLLIAFLSTILFSLTTDVVCEDLPSVPVDTEQKNIQTPKTQEELTSPTVQQEKKIPPGGIVDTPQQGNSIPQTSEETTQRVQGPSPDQPKTPLSNKEKLKQAGKIADDIHEKLSKRIEKSASWFDSFFANERSLAENNHSNMRLGYNFLLEDKYGLTSQPTLNGRLVLPKLEDKFHLIFSVDPDEPLSKYRVFTEDTNNPQVVSDTPRTYVSDQRRYMTALQYFFKSTDELNISIRSGLQFKGLEPIAFVAPRYRQLIPLKSWDFRITQEVMYRTDAKWQETTRLDFERPVHSLFLRITAEGAWYEDTSGYFYSLRLALSQPLGPNNALNYEWINSFQTAPSGLTDSVVRVHYRRNIWHDWVFLEITPQFRFPIDRDHRFTPGIFLGLEAVFGKPD